MSKSRIVALAAVVVVSAAVFSCVKKASPPPETKPVGVVEEPLKKADGPVLDLFVEMPQTMETGRRATARVLAMTSTGPDDARPAAGAQVEVVLKPAAGEPTPVFAGPTGSDGRVEATFTVPAVAPGGWTLEVRGASGKATRESASAVTVREPSETAKILLVTDKPVYQPNQVMHIRALALEPEALRPAAGEMLLEVEDSKGNKVFKRRLGLEAHGVASADFQLADEVLLGEYRITATIGKSKSERTVGVKKYVLPKFKVAIEAEKSWYLPKETVKGTVRSDYFFGKPVAGAVVTIKASTFDVQFREFAKAETKTDAEGVAQFEITLPDYFVGQPLDKGNAYVQLEFAVKDTADHTEKAVKTFSVANAAIQVAAVPESGRLVPGVENVVYAIATSPDGAPVVCDVELCLPDGIRVKGTTDATGIAELRFTPDPALGATVAATIEAKDRKGNVATAAAPLGVEPGRDRILLRLDRAIATAGDTIGIEVLGTFSGGRVFIDAIRGGRAVLMTSCDMKDGRAKAEVTVPPSEFGAMEIHAYRILGTGEIVRDTRVIHVQPAGDLTIALTSDRQQWKPGESATIDFQVTGRDGAGVAAALGVIVVDESVYAIQDLQPGLEKVFFTLAKELQEPKYGLKTGPNIASVVGGPQIAADEQRIARVLLAPVEPITAVVRASTLVDRRTELLRKQALIWRTLKQWILVWKEPFFVLDRGTRRWTPGLLRQIRADKRVKMGETLLTDPWGNEIAMETLEKAHPAFTLDWWNATLMGDKGPALFEALKALAVEGRLVEGGKFAPDILARLPEECARDGFRDPVSVERFAAQDPAFALDNLIRAGENAQRTALFEKLVARAQLGHAVVWKDGGWRYEDKVLESMGFATKRADGTPLSLEAMASHDPALTAAGIARAAQFRRAAEIYAGLIKVADAGAWDTVVTDTGDWQPGLMEILKTKGLLVDSSICADGGGPFTLETMTALDPAFRPQALLAAKMAGRAERISQAICTNYHNKNLALPDDAIARLSADKLLAAADANDPWGTPLKVVALSPGETTSMGCSLLSGQKKLLCAGPDRTFGTGDDFRVDVASAPSSPSLNAPTPILIAGVLAPRKPSAMVPPEFSRQLGLLAGGRYEDGRPTDEPAIFFPDDEESDHNESADADDYGKMKGDSVEFLSAMPGELERPRDVFERKGIGEGGGVRGRFGGRRNLVARGGGSAGPEPPEGIRVRNWFPETLVWQPLLITDERGHARLEVPLADSITTWRMTASASAMDGRLGSATRGLLVFQPFFVDIDFPVALTQNDEVSVPVAVYNYLKEAQDVSLKVQQEDWFELEGEPFAKISLEPSEVRAVHFRIRVTGLGPRRLTVYAWGADESARDAIRREVEVVPDGKMIEVVLNTRLDAPTKTVMTLPPNAIPGTTKIFAKVYPGIFSQVVEGVEGMLGMPHG